MHRIGVVGISWRHRRADVLGAFTIPREERAERVPRLAATWESGSSCIWRRATAWRSHSPSMVRRRSPLAAARSLLRWLDESRTLARLGLGAPLQYQEARSGCGSILIWTK